MPEELVKCDFSNKAKLNHCHIAACDDRVVHVCFDCLRNEQAWKRYFVELQNKPSHDYYVDLQKGY